MKAISVKQPWASLIVHGIKDIENRTWRCPMKYIGHRVLIHASASSWSWYRVLHYLTKPMKDIFIKLGYNGEWVRNQPTGSIIGSVEIVGCSINHPSVWAEKTDGSRGYYENPTYNWVLTNPVLFPEPIPAKGKLSFWEYDRIQETESDGDHKICMCRICVDEKAQVMSMGDHFVCRYCGGRYYK